MVELKENSKIYIISPFHNTGGPKSLHQLANVLIENKLNVFIVYYFKGAYLDNNNKLFDFCKAKLCNEIEDEEKNIIITSEFQTDILSDYKKIKKCIWWLSLDYYFCSDLKGSVLQALRLKKMPKCLFPFMLLKFISNNPNCIKYKKEKKCNLKKYYHFYNCEYVKLFLSKSGVSTANMKYLCGPLEQKFYKIKYLDVKNYKTDCVCYNPAKMDLKFMKKIEKRMKTINPNIKFIPIKNMNRLQVFETLRMSKVYIDFGYFPGPERMPREAVSVYCNLITSTEGSAKNHVDVPIPEMFKFNILKKNSIDNIVTMINTLVLNYEQNLSYGDKYREKVWKQIEEFEQNINEIFEVSL